MTQPPTRPPSADSTEPTPRLGRRRLLKYAAGTAAAAGLAPLLGSCAKRGESSPPPEARGNILVIYADDQRFDTQRFMPTLQELIATEATSFTQARQSTPQCTPSRATMLTGQFATGPDGHGVQTNGGRLTSAQLSATLAPWLSARGYHCGLAGKYLDARRDEVVPDGWAWWRELVPSKADDPFPGQDAHEYGVFDGSTTRLPDVHQTDNLTADVLSFLDTAPEPWFLWDCPTSPHFPMQPTPRRADATTDPDWPIVDEDTSDKPAWLAELPAPSATDVAGSRVEIANMLREVVDLDDHLAAVWERLRSTGAAERTTIIYTSDNGIALLDHRIPLFAKNLPYDVCSHVPMICIGPGFPNGSMVDAPVSAAVDVTATCLDLSGARANVEQRGVSLVAIAAEPGAYADRITWGGSTHQDGERLDVPSNDWVVTDRGRGLRKLIRYPEASEVDRYEAYDLDVDPDELVNWAREPARRDERDDLEVALDAWLG